MKKVSIDELLAKTKNKFLLINAVAGRAKQITEGSLPYIDEFDLSNPIVTALREIQAGKIGIKVLPIPPKAVQRKLVEKPKERLVFAGLEKKEHKKYKKRK